MSVVLAVAAGGAAGSVLRYALSTWLTHATRIGGSGTLAVNLVGAFGLGLLLGLIESRFHAIPRTLAAGMGIGIFGGFTTFSSFMWDAVEHAESGRWYAAAFLVATTVVAGLAAMIAGLALGRAA